MHYKHQNACGSYFYHGFNGLDGIYVAWWLCSYEAHRPYVNLSRGSAQDPSWHIPLTYSHISCHRQEIIRAPSSRMPHTSSDNYQAPSSWDKRWQIALCCLEGSTLSNLVHRRRRCARIDPHSILCLEGSTPEDRGLSLFIALRWMQDPGGVMVWVAENV